MNSPSNFGYYFTIDNFSCHLQETSIPFSYIFPFETIERFQTFVEVTPKGPNNDHISVCLCLTPNQNDDKLNENTNLRVDFSIIDCTGCKSQTKSIKKKLNTSDVTSIGAAKFVHKSFLLDPVNGLLPGDMLTICCQLKMGKETNETSEMDTVLLLSNGKELKVHKSILSSKYKYFEKYFTNQSNPNRIQIDDNPKVIINMINFFYNKNDFSMDTKMSLELLDASIKYEIEELKNYCAQWFCTKINYKTVGFFLVLGDEFNLDLLKTSAIDYINRNRLIMQSPEFHRDLQNKADLMSELFKTFFS